MTPSAGPKSRPTWNDRSKIATEYGPRQERCGIGLSEGGDVVVVRQGEHACEVGLADEILAVPHTRSMLESLFQDGGVAHAGHQAFRPGRGPGHRGAAV